MDETMFEKFFDCIEELLTDDFDLVPSNELVSVITEKLINEWQTITVDELKEFLQSEGLKEATDETTFQFHEDLYNSFLNLKYEEG